MAKGSLGNKIRTYTCAGCGRTVTRRARPGTRYCTLECYRRSQRPQRRTGGSISCAECGEGFYVPACRLKIARYCSRGCLAAAQRRERPGNVQIVANMRAVQAAQVKSRAPTKPERDLYALLDEIGVSYGRQMTIGHYTVDAAIPERRLVVEADGDYWHGHTGSTDPRVRNRMRLDRSRDSFFANRGWHVLRLWGSELANDPDGCRSKISQAIHRPLEGVGSRADELARLGQRAV